MKQIKTRLTHGEGIALDEFKSFFFFLNNLEDFTIAVHYYSLANERILIIVMLNVSRSESEFLN